MWENEFIPTELGWTMLVIIQKSNVDTQRIRLLEVVWKLVEAVLDKCIKIVVHFNDVLHGVFSGRGTGMAIMDLKPAQKLADVDQNLLFLVFLDLRNAYDNLDLMRLLQTLVGYRARPKLRGLLEEFWLHQEVVTCQN